MDADESGELDREEVAQLSKDMGAVLSEAELDAAMLEMDEDGSGQVDFDEFRSWYFGNGKSKWKELVEQYAPWQLALAPPEQSPEQIKKENALKEKRQAEQDFENLRRISLVYIRSQIIDIYLKHNPKKIDDVDQLIEEWKGQEDVLLWNIQQKYVGEADAKRRKGRCWP